MGQDYELRDKTVVIKITNDVLRNVFNELKAELLIHIRRSLENNEIKIELEAIENDDSKMIYTNKEKFNYLAEKHPDLLYMKDKLGLDTDF